MLMLEQLIPEAKSLSRDDKLRLVQVLVNDIAEDAALTSKYGANFAVWSPVDAHAAGDVMLDALAKDSRA